MNDRSSQEQKAGLPASMLMPVGVKLMLEAECPKVT